MVYRSFLAAILLICLTPSVSHSDNLRFHINRDTLFGAVIGGVIGYQYNDDRGAVVGSLLGALAASNVADYQRHRWYEVERTLQLAHAREHQNIRQELHKLQLENAFVISLAASELFVADSLDISDAMLPALEQLVQSMLVYPTAVISIAGHTDSRGQEYPNRILGLQRAEAIASYLILQGIPRSRLKTHGVGEAEPIAPNDTDANRRLNNRVEIKPL